MNIGIVGHEASKFTLFGEQEARQIIRELLAPEGTVLVSGGCHLGGIDIWAEEEADLLGREKLIFLPKVRQWPGYRARNLQIVQASHSLHCLAVVRLARSYCGMQFSTCYHCGTTDHVKGGGCWTIKQARLKGKKTYLHKIGNEE